MFAMLAALFCVFLCLTSVFGCTTIVVGKAATTDGSVLSSHSDDGSGRSDPRLVPTQRMYHREGALRPIYPDIELFPRYVGRDRSPAYFPGDGQNVTQPIGFIPQVNRTYSFFEATYGIMNEFQVSISESTCSSKITAKGCTFVGQRERLGNCALMSIDALSLIAMERATTAREAVQVIGDLAEEYGFHGPAGGIESGAESLIIADPHEAFVFHILPSDENGTSAVWVAQRVPDAGATVVPNVFIIRNIDFNDAINFIVSPTLRVVAKARGWWTDGTPLDFAKVFSGGEYAHRYYSGRRIWRAFSLLVPSESFVDEYEDLILDNPYPVFVTPDAKVSVADIIAIHRDWYGGTKYDMTAGLAGGPFGTPNRYTGGEGEREVNGSWERPIDLFRTTYIHINQARAWLPNEVGGVFWFSQTGAHGGCLVPFFAGFPDAVPDQFSSGWGGNFSRDSSYWAFRAVNTLLDLHFNRMIADVVQEQKKWEKTGQQLVDDLVVEYIAHHNSAYVIAALSQHAVNVVQAWWSLSDFLLFRYADGFDNVPNAGQPIGYPAWWLRAVGYENGPPPKGVVSPHLR